MEWDEGFPHWAGLNSHFKAGNKTRYPWGIMLVALPSLPGPDEEKQQLIYDLDSALPWYL